MNEQNPFNFEQDMAAITIGSVLQIDAQPAVAQIVSIPGLYQRPRRADSGMGLPAFNDFDITNRQDPFSNQLNQNVVLFPRAQRVQVSEEGVFVPSVLFGRDAQARFRQEQRPDGHIQIVVYGTLRGERANIRRREEALDRSLELQWLREHQGEYTGQWVALQGDRLIESGENGREVFEAARAQGVASPFLAQVEPADELPFGGW